MHLPNNLHVDRLLTPVLRVLQQKQYCVQETKLRGAAVNSSLFLLEKIAFTSVNLPFYVSHNTSQNKIATSILLKMFTTMDPELA